MVLPRQKRKFEDNSYPKILSLLKDSGCFSKFFTFANLTFHLGAHHETICQKSEGCVEVEIIQVCRHENYPLHNETTNDIALIK